MSRSIHDTRGVFQSTLLDDYADPDLKREHLSELRTNIRRQRNIKRRLREQRGRDTRPPFAPFDPDLAPIHRSDEGKYVHHAATEEDLRAVMRRMPPGFLDGLGPIYLCANRGLGRHADDTTDPYTGRPGSEILPGVYAPAVRGYYFESDGRVVLYAHVHEAGAPGPLAIYLKLRTLATFVHEASHHHDYTFRTTGDRWRMDDGDENEEYARTMAWDLVYNCVAPYLEERYPAECTAFRDWQLEHAGHHLELDEYTDDRPGWACAGHGLEGLALAVAAGEDPMRARLLFAQHVQHSGYGKQAARILATVLARQPDDPNALYLDARTAFDDSRHDDVEASLRRVLTIAPNHASARVMLACLYRSQARWGELAALTAQEPEACSARRLAILRKLRARAALELGRWESFAQDLDALRGTDDEHAGPDAALLEALELCRTARWEEAMGAADRLLRSPRLDPDHGPEARAVGLESALRLGRSWQPYRLSDEDVKRLRRNGHGAWIDRLLAEAVESRR